MKVFLPSALPTGEYSADVEQEGLTRAALATDCIHLVIVPPVSILQQGLQSHSPSPAASQAGMRSHIYMLIRDTLDRHGLAKIERHCSHLNMKQRPELCRSRHLQATAQPKP